MTENNWSHTVELKSNTTQLTYLLKSATVFKRKCKLAVLDEIFRSTFL